MADTNRKIKDASGGIAPPGQTSLPPPPSAPPPPPSASQGAAAGIAPPPGSSFNAPSDQAPEEQGLLSQAWDTLMGSARAINTGSQKQVQRMFPDEIYNILNAKPDPNNFGKVINPPPRDFSKLEPVDNLERAGAWGTEALTYLTPAKWEMKGAQLLQGMLRNAPKWLRVGGQAAGNAAMGGATGAATAAVNNQDPTTGAIWGSAVPAVGTTLKTSGLGEKIVTPIREWARESLARSFEPGTKLVKRAIIDMVDPILNSKKMWYSQKGLRNLAKKEVEKSVARKAYFAPGENALVDWDEAVRVIQEARDKAYKRGVAGGDIDLSSYTGPSGPKTTLSSSDDDVLKAFEDEIFAYMNKVKQVDSNTGKEFIPFDQLERLKQTWQDTVAEYGGFLGAPEAKMAVKLKAQKTAANATRPLLEDFAGDAWANENSIQHLWLNAKKVGQEGYEKDLSRVASPYKKPFTGFGAKLSMNPGDDKAGMLLRAIRHLTDTPAYNRMTAQAKWSLANLIAKNEGLTLAQVANMLLNRGESGLEGGETVPLGNGPNDPSVPISIPPKFVLEQ